MKASTIRAVLCNVGLMLGVTLVLSGAPASRASIPNDDKTIGHVLNRLGFGARPGDIERVRAMASIVTSTNSCILNASLTGMSRGA
jgi:hypothetical protein